VLAVRAVDLDDLYARFAQVARQAGAVGAAAFHPDTDHFAEACQPGQQLPVARRGGGELLDAELAADAVEGGGHVGVEMGVDPADDGHSRFGDDGVFCHGGSHCCPFIEQLDGMAHTTGRRTRQRRVSETDS
jgi:hypothetical protein